MIQRMVDGTNCKKSLKVRLSLIIGCFMRFNNDCFMLLVFLQLVIKFIVLSTI